MMQTVELETATHVQCPVCANPSHEEVTCIFEGLLKCSLCGFIFAGPDAPVGTDYEDDFAQSCRHPTYEFVQGRFRGRNTGKLNALLDKLEPYRKLNRIVDVGCSYAYFMKLAKDRGWQPLGVEISDFGVKFSREELGIEMFQGMLEDAKLPDASVDVITSSHVMEHVADPVSLISEMRRILRPGGAVLTVVPTQFRSPSYLIANDLPGEGPPRHVAYYSRENYNRLLERQGFDVVYSAYNTEIQRLVRALKNSGKSAAAASAPAAKPVPAPAAEAKPAAVPASTEPKIRGGFDKPSPEQTLPVLMLKSAINKVCTLAGVGDELIQIAVKRG